jgi:MSHA biogenesis protein MshQ
MRLVKSFLVCLVALAGAGNSTLASAQIPYAELFPDPVTAHASGNLNIADRVQFNGGDHLLNFTNIADNSGNDACDGQRCIGSGQFTPSLNLPAFKTATGNTNMRVHGKDTTYLPEHINQLTVYDGKGGALIPNQQITMIRQLKLAENTRITVHPGVYFIENFEAKGEIRTTNSGVVLFLVKNMTIAEEFNRHDKEHGRVGVVAYETVNIRNDVDAYAWFYAKNNFNIGEKVKIYGGVNARNVNIGKNSNVTAQAADISALIAHDTFAYLDNSPKLIGYWDFDTKDADSTIDIEAMVPDSIAANHAQKRSGMIHQNNAKFCEGGYFNGEGAHLNIPNHASYNSERGTLAFWAKADDLDHQFNVSHGDQYLFSKDSLSFDNGGHLTSWFSSDGALHVRYQTPSAHHFIHTDDALIQEDEWFHYALTWDNQKIILYFNGEEVGRYTSAGGDQRRNLEPMIFGANARISGDQSSEYDDLYDFFKGHIDDIRWYDKDLNAEQVLTLKTMTADCEPDGNKGLVAQYRFADKSWDAQHSIKDSSGNGLHASPSGEMRLVTPVNNMSCGTLDIPANTDQSTPDFIDTLVDLESHVGPNGTISFWFKSNSGWQDERDRTLFDAVQITESSTKHVNNKYFYLQLLENGQLEFGFETDRDHDTRFVTDERFTFPEFTWVHIALSWDYADRSIKIYLNGDEKPVTMWSQDRNRSWNGIMPDYGFIAFGDNRTDYITASSSANGRFDDIRLYSHEQTRAEIIRDRDDIEPCAVLYGYKIIHPDQALTCEGAKVTIKACKNADCTELLNDKVQIQLSPTPDGDPAGVMYEFTSEMAFNLQNPVAETKQIQLTPLHHTMAETLVNTCSSSDCQVDFVDAGLQIYQGTQAPQYDAGLPLHQQNTARFPITAGASMDDVFIRAVRNNEGACEAAIAGNQAVTLNYACYIDVDGTRQDGCAVPFVKSLRGTGPQSVSLEMSFDRNGVASFADQRMYDATNMVLSASTVVNGATLHSNTADIAFHPAGLSLRSSLPNTPVAGEPFALTIFAYGEKGSELPSYQYQTLLIDAYHVAPDNPSSYGDFVLAANVRASANPNINLDSDVSPTIRNALTFADGSVTLSNVTYSEAGVAEMVITDRRYGQSIVSNVLRFGPFVPAYFDVEHTYTPTVANSSGSFTYVGQPFGFDFGLEPQLEVTAYNALGQIVTNYFDSAWTLRPTAADVQDEVSFINQAGNGVSIDWVNSPTTPLLSQLDVADGRGRITLSNLNLAFQKTATPVAAFNGVFDVNFAAEFLTDANGVCYQSDYPGACDNFVIQNIGGNELRYGRVNLVNSYGPETESLRIPLIAEYFTASGWLLNRDDSSTNINLSQSLGQIGVALSLDSPNDIVTSLTGVTSSGFLLNGKSGINDLLFPAPDEQGAVTVTLNPLLGSPLWAEYLNVDWNGDGVIDALDSPSATLNFGLFRGNDRKLNYREVM